jgi:hypothetical protein
LIDFLPGIVGWNLFNQLPENHDILRMLRGGTITRCRIELDWIIPCAFAIPAMSAGQGDASAAR